MNPIETARRWPHRGLIRRPSRGLALAGLLMCACVSTASAAGPGIRHELVMRGQVLEAEAGSLVVCVGERDGAEVGQVLNVVRHVRTGGGPKQQGARYRREAVGRARIVGLFDGHYADAKVVEGKPRVNDTVELASR